MYFNLKKPFFYFSIGNAFAKIFFLVCECIVVQQAAAVSCASLTSMFPWQWTASLHDFRTLVFQREHKKEIFSFTSYLYTYCNINNIKMNFISRLTIIMSTPDASKKSADNIFFRSTIAFHTERELEIIFQ